MRRTILLSTIFALTLFLTGYLSVVHAEQTSSAENAATGTATTGSTTGFDWRWLIPLLAIPVIFFLFKSDNEDQRPDYRDQGIIGAKGGKTRRELDEEAGKFDNNTDDEEE